MPPENESPSYQPLPSSINQKVRHSSLANLRPLLEGSVPSSVLSSSSGARRPSPELAPNPNNALILPLPSVPPTLSPPEIPSPPSNTSLPGEQGDMLSSIAQNSTLSTSQQTRASPKLLPDQLAASGVSTDRNVNSALTQNATYLHNQRLLLLALTKFGNTTSNLSDRPVAKVWLDEGL
jgi:hypothetical protein